MVTAATATTNDIATATARLMRTSSDRGLGIFTMLAFIAFLSYMPMFFFNGKIIVGRFPNDCPMLEGLYPSKGISPSLVSEVPPPAAAAAAAPITLPLQELVDAGRPEASFNCTAPTRYVRDTILDPALAYQGGRKIPRIVHITGLSRCNHEVFADNIDNWRLKDHSLFYHDDEAVAKLLYRDWSEFPQLRFVLECLPQKGAIWADVWRLLVLWEYGGVYSDMDTAPKPHMFNETTITAEDDAYFVIEVLGTPSQWFMAASPKHPMIYFCIQAVIKNLISIKNLASFPVVFTTGPGAVGDGFNAFIRHTVDRKNVTAGQYEGVGNRSVTLAGDRKDQDMYLTRVVVRNNDKKHELMAMAGMKHLTHMKLKTKNLVDDSCMERMWKRGKFD